MRPSKTLPLSRARKDDRSAPLFVLPRVHQLGDGWSLRRGFLRCCGLGRRLAAWWTMLGLLALITASGPHLVHHLPDLHRQDDHRSHADRPRLLDCLILSLMQHTPVTEGLLDTCLAPLAVGEQAVLDQPRAVLEEPRSGFQARAPPA